MYVFDFKVLVFVVRVMFEVVCECWEICGCYNCSDFFDIDLIL